MSAFYFFFSWSIVIAIFTVSLYMLIRLFIVLLSLGKCNSNQISGKIKVLVIAGSGGHTSEVIRLLSCLSADYQPRIYVVANTDNMSREKINKFEAKKGGEKSYIIHSVPRSREVQQSYFTSVFSTLYSTIYAFPLVFSVAPDLILCNGPGTCIPLCVAGFFMRILGLKQVLQVYVESICRVKHLSLSGKIMYYLADHIIVQWPSLLQHYPKAEYIGKLV